MNDDPFAVVLFLVAAVLLLPMRFDLAILLRDWLDKKDTDR